MAKKKKKYSKHKIVWALLVPVLIALIGGAAIYTHTVGVAPHVAHVVHVPVKEKQASLAATTPSTPPQQAHGTSREKSVDELWLEAMSPDMLTPSKDLQVSVNDLAQPPSVVPDKGMVIEEDKKEIAPAYEEKNPPPDVAFVVPPPAKFAGRPKIALLIDDMGLRTSESEDAIKLPASVSLSFLPYAPHLQEQADHAKAAGHELLLHLPMQPLGGDNPGPGALMTSLSLQDNRVHLLRALESFTGFDGVNNHMGSKFTSSREQMMPILNILKEKGLFFLDSRTSPQTVGVKLAQEIALPHVARDVFLDDTISEAAIKAQLEKTEQVAKRRGSAVAIGHPHSVTLALLSDWVKHLEERGFDLVPVKALVK